MTDYIGMVLLLNFIVDSLLILSVNYLTGFAHRWHRIGLAALLGGLYGAACMIPQLDWLGHVLLRILCLFLIGIVAFGISFSSMKRSMLFCVLCLSLEGFAWSMDAGGFFEIIGLCIGLCVCCICSLRARTGGREYIQISIEHNNKTLELTAFKDTGNMLRDPMTGLSVIILSAEMAKELLGLTQKQLQNPVETVANGAVKGLRLLPCKTVTGRENFLLAKRMDEVKIGRWQGSCLVAFSSVTLDAEGSYQALTGGSL